MAVVLLATTVALLVSLVQLTRRGDDVIERWSPASARSIALLAGLVDEDDVVRGYAFSHRAALVDSYTRALDQQRKNVAALRVLVGDQRAVAGLLDDVATRAETWQARIARPALHGALAPAQLLAADPREFGRVRSAAERLRAELAGARARAVHKRALAFRWVWASGGVGGLLVLLAFPAVWFGLHRGVLRPVERLAGQTRDVADGDLGRSIEPFGPLEVYRLGQDVERMRERIEDELARVERAREVLAARGDELARSNSDLEQFAYVASHDLSEPLRKVANFCQLLERQYAAQLDDKARQYIGFAVDGAKRMQILIGDLLAFSRVGRTTEHFEPVPLEAALDRAVLHLEERVRDSGASIDRGPLPVVEGDASLLAALFQNLVGNALKYRAPDRAPRVVVRAERHDGPVTAPTRATVPPVIAATGRGQTATSPPATTTTNSSALAGPTWLVSVEDNGIGIDPQYAERIFVIFQRLHLRDQYGGTGIGLALCRRIVEFHGGSIWLDARDGPGARFCFTIPERRDTTDPSDM